jgi:SSS family solute:Na+ symporter
MTLYQRIYASKGEKEAKKAAHCGVFEWPIMAFMGVILGMLAKVAATKECLMVLLTRNNG